MTINDPIENVDAGFEDWEIPATCPICDSVINVASELIIVSSHGKLALAHKDCLI